MNIVKVDSYLFQEVNLHFSGGPLEISVVATAEIDCGIMDDENYRKFCDADSDKGIKKARWEEAKKSFKFTFEPSEQVDYWLIIYNAYSWMPVYAAYSAYAEGKELDLED